MTNQPFPRQAFDASRDENDVPTLEMPASTRMLAIAMVGPTDATGIPPPSTFPKTTYALAGVGRTEVCGAPPAANEDARNAETLPAPPSEATRSGIHAAGRWLGSQLALRAAETLPEVPLTPPVTRRRSAWTFLRGTFGVCVLFAALIVIAVLSARVVGAM